MTAIESKKKLILIITVSVLIVGGIIAAILVPKARKTAKENESLVSATESTSEYSENVFAVKTVKLKGKKIKVLVSLEQKVSICNFKVGIHYDSQHLKLLDYDSELSLYSPTVNPEKKGDEIQWDRGTNDVIEMTWASAKNCTASGDIISMEFEVVDKYEGSVPVTLAVEDIGVLDETFMVVKSSYKIDYYEE